MTHQFEARQIGTIFTTLSTHDHCDAVALSIPARSQLYHLSPIGVGTLAVESLTSYIMRLAQAHSVSTRTLVVDMVFPLYGRSYLVHHSLRRFWEEQTRALNGTNTSTCDLVRVLEQLTRRSGLHMLTMLTWANILPPRGLLRSHREWCPLCYAEWRARGQVVYEPLSWALEVVTVCSRHHLELRNRYPSCQWQTLPLEAHSCPGHCGQCGQWLGSDSERCAVEPQGNGRDLSHELWVATAVGELLAHIPSITLPPRRDRLVAVVSAYVNRAGGGSNAALARLLGCSKYTIRDCCRGEQLLQLGTLLKLSKTGGVSLLRLLTDETLLACLPPITNTNCNALALYRGPYRKVNKDQLLQQLQAEVSNPPNPPKSFHAVAEALGFDPSYLAKQCPHEAQVIKVRYEAYVEGRKQRLRAPRFEELRQIITRLAADGIYPSQKRVAAELGHAWFLRLPEARVEWRRLVSVLESGRT